MMKLSPVARESTACGSASSVRASASSADGNASITQGRGAEDLQHLLKSLLSDDGRHFGW